MSDVVSRVATTLGNVVRGRAVSLTKYIGPSKFNDVLQRIFGLIPDVIPIPGSDDLILEGGISDNFTVVKDSYISIPMDVSL
mmetsp:Transcript_21730/g.33531  ORF Transcript_21730/g.33531 Transcript_21730/m.33531 type:complete len:82 (+) Transcript_21730:636-881(+)